MNFRLARPALLLAVATLSGCSTISGWFSSDDNKPGPLPAFNATVTPKVVWQQAIGKVAEPAFNAVTADQTVYAAAPDGTLASIDAASGRVNWKVNTGAPLAGGVGASNGRVVVSSPKGDVFAFDTAGKPLWKTKVSSEVFTAPTVGAEQVVVWSGDGRYFGINSATGKELWAQSRSVPALSVRNYAGGVIHRGAVFFGTAGGKLVGVDLASGATGWEGNVATPKGATELERIADITSRPYAEEKQVCAAAFQGRVACFEPQSGNLIWTREVSSHGGLVADKQYLYITDEKGAIYAFDKSTGASVWKQDKLQTAKRRPSGPQFVGAYLAVVDVEGYIHLISRETGDLVGRIAGDGSAVQTQPVASGDTLIVQTRNGNLIAVRV